MAESREKSEQLRKQFEEWAEESYGGAIGKLLARLDPQQHYGQEYVQPDVQTAWKAFQYGETIGREAGRRDALEEQWISVEEKLPNWS
jgi:hypothetical protein